MKLAFYAQEGTQQIILTPESAPERAILNLLHQPRDITVTRGSFTETVGGYLRKSLEEESTFIVLSRPVDPPTSDARQVDIVNLALKSKAVYDAMSPEEKAAHDQAQRESFVRGMMPTGDPRLD